MQISNGVKKIIFLTIFLFGFLCFNSADAASARRTGTNESISTYGGATRQYTSLATWEAATDNDLVTLAKSEVLEVYDDAASFNDYVLLGGAITNSSYFRIIRPASGQGHDGTPNNGVTFSITTDTVAVMAINENYGQIQDIIGKMVINSATARAVFGWGNVTSPLIVGAIAFDSNNTGAGGMDGFKSAGGTGGAFINCLAHNILDGCGFVTLGGTGDTYFYNCTATNNSLKGFQEWQSGGTFTCKNCLASGNNIDFAHISLGTMAISYSASSDATADDWGGTGNRINQTFSFVSSGSDNFHLISTDAGARNYGTSLASDATFAFDDDINDGTMGAGKAGQSRLNSGVWDIGFDEEPPPSISSVSLNSGSNIVLNEGTYKWASTSMTATDSSGCSTISSVTATAYRTATSTNGTTCAQNDNNCYPSSYYNACTATTTGNICTGVGDTSAQYDCGFKFWYIADPTDSGTYAGNVWAVSATATDTGGLTGTATNTAETIEVQTLLALDVTSSISYGSLSPGENTGSTNQTTTVTNTGNANMDPQLSGTDMTCSGNTIVVAQQKYSDLAFTYSSGGTALSSTPTTINLSLSKPTATTSPVTDDVYWGIAIPSGTAACTPYSGTNTFSAIGGT